MNDEDSPEVVEARMTAALKRALATPPKPHNVKTELKEGKTRRAVVAKATVTARKTKPKK
jgi:hypothetical protein